MGQHDYNLANQSRTNFRQDLNNALTAILSANSGASAPTTTTPYMLWADTTTGLLKIRNAADSAWIIVGTLASAYLGLADLATANDFTASQKLKGDALIWRFKDTGGSGVEWAIRSDGGNLELCENTGTEGSPTWTVRKIITSNGILNPYIASAGTDTYTATYSPVIASLVDGMELEIEFGNASTGAATLNVNSLGAKKLYIESSGDYAQAGSGDIFAGMRTSISYKSSLDTGSGGWVIKNKKGSGAAAATQAEQEAGSSITVMTTPGRQQYHTSAAKAWVHFDGTGTVTIRASYNVSSITDNAARDYTINFTTAFSSIYYAAVGSCSADYGVAAMWVSICTNSGGTEVAPTTAAIRVISSGSSNDTKYICVACFGDQ